MQPLISNDDNSNQSTVFKAFAMKEHDESDLQFKSLLPLSKKKNIFLWRFRGCFELPLSFNVTVS